MKKRNCLVGQSGGPTAAINASLAGVIAQCLESEQFDNIYGAVNGIKGLLALQYLDLKKEFDTAEKLEQLRHTPAMFLGSCRYKLPNYDEDPNVYKEVFDIFERLEITDFFYIGGNDSMDTVLKLSGYAKMMNKDVKIIGIPKTIDNDLMGTDHTPGFGSAAKYVATSMLEIAHDSMIYQLQSITIVEIMGRNAGWLTAAAALARNGYNTAPDLIYLPEVTFDKEKFIEAIAEVFKHKRGVVIAVSEGIRDKDGNYLDQDSRYTKKDAFGHIIHSGTAKVLETIAFQAFHCKVRSIELNVLQRCAMHIASKCDNDESFLIGKEAVLHALRGETGKMMVFNRKDQEDYEIEIGAIDVLTAANYEKKVPVEWINEAGNDITDKLYQYLYPLILGEVYLSYQDGIPQYLSTAHLEK
ncbi:6-phosphofructokinase [Beduini massiliensis]|uniref:6-phosphofructokinase n=1 Tax=Beduini massiliensis TaxID=1585974 RepID=UPI00059A7F2E|nr:6-phosphofructokinase [Beduini massiliensis]